MEQQNVRDIAAVERLRGFAGDLDTAFGGGKIRLLKRRNGRLVVLLGAAGIGIVPQ